MTTHILSSRSTRVRYWHVIAGKAERGYSYDRLVTVLISNTNAKYGVGMDVFHRAEIAPDTVRLIRFGGFTPAGNEMIVWADIPRADYDHLVKVAEQRYPDALRLNEKVVEALATEATP